MVNKLFGNIIGGRAALGLLLARLVFGVGIALHGWSKIQNPFGWMGPDAPVPGALQALAALSEFGGGVALILGLLTPLAMFGLACTMLTAITTVHLAQGHPFVARGGPSYELATLYLGFAVLMIIAGPGRYSIDAILFGKNQRRR
ncbi:MAG: DoxX family protein [Acidobacteriota bacterium]|jgi:putative oxidoreductase